ncbi:glucokinase regulatory protein-like [Styela clava]
MDNTPFTERSNEITEKIDVSTPAEMVELLRLTDSEIFSGVNTEGLFSERVLESISGVTSLVEEFLRNFPPEDIAIVLAGCGTSGRLGYLISKVCNKLTSKLSKGRPFYYSIAGGNKSILTSQEAPEDDPNAGVQSLLEICHNKKKVIYFGITCGISAPFVGGQLDYCMKHLDKFIPVLLGFNPLNMARDVEIVGWDKTLRTVASDLNVVSLEGKGFVINPVLGGEAITGSSRMKGGTATKVILETIFLSALNDIGKDTSNTRSCGNVTSILKLYEEVCRNFYKTTANVMSALVQRGGVALTADAKIRYVASGWMGVVPLIDSTECPPTFGSSVDDVRGFVHGGYDFLGIENFGQQEKYFQLGVNDFIKMYKSQDVGNDAVIVFIQSQDDPIMTSILNNDLGDVLINLKGKNKIVAVLLENPTAEKICETDMNKYFDDILRVTFPEYDKTALTYWSVTCREALEESLYSCCLKWLVNATSTGGHVLLGKVFMNYMCDVKVSNNKLYYRAIEIIKKMCHGVSHEKATNSLLKSIYETNVVTEERRNKTVAEHYIFAARKDKVVPLAIVLAKMDCSVKVAKETLQKHSVVRQAILEMAKPLE